MFRLNFWGKSLMSPGAGVSLGTESPYMQSVLPPPPAVSMLYTSSPAPLVLPASLYRRSSVNGFINDDSENSSPVLKDRAVESDRVNVSSPRLLGCHRQLDGAERTSTTYPSLMLHTQLEALSHYHYRQLHIHEESLTDIRSTHCCPATKSPAVEESCDASASATACRQTGKRSSSPVSNAARIITVPAQLHTDDAKSPTRKSGQSDVLAL